MPHLSARVTAVLSVVVSNAKRSVTRDDEIDGS